MRPNVERISLDPGCCVSLFRKRTKAFTFMWHHHPECELTLIEKSCGTRFVGDSVEPYADFDMVLMGPWVPHSWYSDQGMRNSALVFQIDARLLSAAWPELEPIRRLSKQARYGLLFSKSLARWTQNCLSKALHLQGMARTMEVIRVMEKLSKVGPDRTLSKIGFGPEENCRDERIEKICHELRTKLSDPPSHTKLAHQFGLTPPSLSRAFKRVVGRTLSQWLAEERIGQVCSLLIETDKPVTEICYDSGFQNISTFNRTFRLLKKQSPIQFRLLHRNAERNVEAHSSEK